jgi:hypothetical protein
MAISGIQVINVGLPNESAGSDSLYTAFNKTVTNFTTLFGCASPYNTFTGGVGITTNVDANTSTVTITNAGVTELTAGTGIVLSGTTGNITISSTGGGGSGGGTVTSVGLVPVSSTRLTVTNSPIVSDGTMGIDLANSGVTAGSYTYPSMTVDQFGRVTAISNAASVGTVTSVGMVTSGIGIQLSGSPITTAGNITIVNTGVTRLSAGTGINLSGSNGNVTISTTTTGGTVTSVGVSSSSLTVTNSPITSVGTIGIELPANVTVTGQLLLSSSENLSNGAAANLSVTASYFTTTGASTATLAAGSTGQLKTFMMVADGGDMVITVTNAGWKTSGTGTITFGDIGDGCTLQYINSKWFCIGQNGVVFA